MRRKKKCKLSLSKFCLTAFAGVIIFSNYYLVRLLPLHGNAGLSSNVMAAPSVCKKPRLEKYVNGWNITGNVSWLLDFSIVGFPKTGQFERGKIFKNTIYSILGKFSKSLLHKTFRDFYDDVVFGKSDRISIHVS